MPPPPAVVSLNVITAVLLAVGGFGGLVAFLKYPRDNDRVIVSTAEGLHTIQSGIIDQLQEEIGRIRTLRDQAEAESERCRKQIDALESQVDELKREMREYRRSIG
jgi:peptidoglycan hydrolase CwlO-like protein